MILRRLYSESPPEPRTQLANNPTLLFSWWCTGFAAVIILLRVCGRYIRTERLFREDKVMFWSLIPLFIRMALVHVILRYGTNNVDSSGLDSTEIHQRVIGSKLVLASRIFYAMFIWVAKWTVSEFLKRTISTSWTRSYELGLRFIRIFLTITFLAVVIATLAECQPFDDYWQVVPIPKPKCRQGFAQLITMGTADMITDILLVVFPIAIMVKSAFPAKRKFILSALFSLSAVLIAITAYRVPAVIDRKGKQQFRSLLASCEIVASAAVTNAVVLGSFLRDRGVKKNKYRHGSVTDSLDRSSTRRPTMTAAHWGSDEDLVKDMCYRLKPELHNTTTLPRPAPIAQPAMPPKPPQSRKDSVLDMKWQFPKLDATGRRSRPTEAGVGEKLTTPSPDEFGKSPMSFADIGGLLQRSLSNEATQDVLHQDTSARDFAPQSRRGSRPLLADLGGLSPHASDRSPNTSRRSSPLSEAQPAAPAVVRSASFSRPFSSPRSSIVVERPLQRKAQGSKVTPLQPEELLSVPGNPLGPRLPLREPRTLMTHASAASADSHVNWPLGAPQAIGQEQMDLPNTTKDTGSDQVSTDSSSETTKSWFAG